MRFFSCSDVSNMIVLPDTTTYDSSIRLEQILGSTTKASMLKVCDKLDLYVSHNLLKGETAHRLAQELLDNPIEILTNLGKQDLLIVDEFVRGSAYVVRKMRKTPYKLQKLLLVATYCDEQRQEWHMLMPNSLRKALSADYRLFLDLAEQGIKAPTAKQLRMMELAKWIMGER